MSIQLSPTFCTHSFSQETTWPALVRTSLHTEDQKFGKKPLPAQLTFFDLLDSEIEDPTKRKELQEKAIEYSLEVIGIDLTEAQNKALFAVQKLLHETDYKGNLPSKFYDGNNRFRFMGELPALRFSPAQYLEAYGVSKYQTSRGYMEFSGEERRQSLQALVDLVKKQNLFV